MKAIEKLVHCIDDEIEGAKEYAEKALMSKAEGDTNWYNRYKEMATDELKHAGWIHDYAVAKIDKLKAIYTAPTEMQDAWNKSHAEYVERVAWIKQMLTM